MNWFERHLNWTAIIITFGGFLFTYIVVLFTLGFNLFIPAEDIDQDFRYYLLIVIFTCTAIPVIGMAWIIRKKNQNYFFISFFIPSLFSFLTLFFPLDYLIYGPQYSLSTIITVFILIGIWLTGLVVILLLKNRSVSIQPPGEVADYEPLEGDFLVEERPSKEGQYKRAYIYVIVASLLIAFTVSGYSFFNIYHGYKLFVHDVDSYMYDSPMYENGDCQYSKFTFECKKNFYESGHGCVIRYWGEEVGLWRDKLELFTVVSSGIYINVIPHLSYWHYLPGSTLVEECIHYFYLSDYGGPLYNTPTINNLAVTQVSVDGIPAEYAAFIQGRPDSDYYYPWDEIKMVCFEREGCIWVIRMENDKDKTVDPDPDFERLIETFRIVD